MDFPHRQVCRVTAFHGDPAALGAAVTMTLCGHWEHDGPCRWPHHTSSEDSRDEHGARLVTVPFAASEFEEPLVRKRIHEALAIGSLTGPDGTTSSWTTAD